MPMSRACTGTCVMSSPPTRMRPASGSSKPAIMRNVVVLPQPDGPSSAKNSPGCTIRSTRSTTRVLPSKLFSMASRRTSRARVEGLFMRRRHGAVGVGKGADSMLRTLRAEKAAPCPPSTLWWARRASARLCPPYGASTSTLQDLRHARVDVVLALVVPFPVDLDQRRDLGLGVVELRVVLRVELHLLVRGRIPDR